MDSGKIKIIALLLFLLSQGVHADGPPLFSFHLKNEPHTIDPVQISSGGDVTYIFSNLYRTLIRYTDDHGLVFEHAEKCQQKIDTLVTCKLRKGLRWSDGTPLTSQDYVTSFRRLLEPTSRASNLDLLFSIKNGKEIHEGTKKSDTLGMKATTPLDIEFELVEPDREFLDKLSNPLLAAYKPLKEGQSIKDSVVSGPYKIKDWIKGKKIILEPNQNFTSGNPKRPHIEIFFAEEESTGVSLYEKGVIKFLWRLPTGYIPQFKSKPGFFQKPMARFDYIGFNMKAGSPFQDKELRKAFAHSLNFEDFKKLFFALGAPGCPSLGERFLNPDGHCVDFVPGLKKLNLKKPIKFYFSQLGGDDIKKAAEWFQQQWRHNLGVTVEIRGLENKNYLSVLKTATPDAFRKGIALNRPTCLAGLENFRKDHPENYIGFYNKRYEQLTQGLKFQKLSRSAREGVCGVANDLLFKEEFVGVPLGLMHFTMMMDPHFIGWTLNELNQLDLAQLEYIEKVP